MTAIEQVILELEELKKDPLSIIFIKTWCVNGGQIRFNSGDVQVRRNGSKYFSFGEPVEKFITMTKALLPPTAP